MQYHKFTWKHIFDKNMLRCYESGSQCKTYASQIKQFEDSVSREYIQYYAKHNGMTSVEPATQKQYQAQKGVVLHESNT